jgi:nitrogen fixation NifU-like protein
MSMDALYQEIILDHYKHPHGRGLREPYQAQAHHVNPTCGDEITLRVNVKGDSVADVSYEGEGCSISQAAASVLHDLLVGRPVSEALARHEAFVALMSGRGQVKPDEELLEDAVAFAGVAKYPARVKCALLPWMAFKDATARALAGTPDRTTSSEGEPA